MNKLIIYLSIISFSLFGLADAAFAKGGSHSSSSHRSSSANKSTNSTKQHSASNSTSYKSSVRHSSTKKYSTSSHKPTGNVSVHSYTKRDGTFVPAHHRSHPDSSFNNNWSIVGNTNPYTGKQGTKTHQ
jgi:hypothetical protein